MRDPAVPVGLRFEAAKSAAPYIHPKLAVVEYSGPDGGLHIVEIRWRDCEEGKSAGALAAT
jgi:hypothetical protein